MRNAYWAEDGPRLLVLPSYSGIALPPTVEGSGSIQSLHGLKRRPWYFDDDTLERRMRKTPPRLPGSTITRRVLRLQSQATTRPIEYKDPKTEIIV